MTNTKFSIISLKFCLLCCRTPQSTWDVLTLNWANLISGQEAQAAAVAGGGEAPDEEGRRLRVVLPRADHRVVGESAQGVPGEAEGRHGLEHRSSRPQAGRRQVGRRFVDSHAVVARYLSNIYIY